LKELHPGFERVLNWLTLGSLEAVAEISNAERFNGVSIWTVQNLLATREMQIELICDLRANLTQSTIACERKRD